MMRYRDCGQQKICSGFVSRAGCKQHVVTLLKLGILCAGHSSAVAYGAYGMTMKTVAVRITVSNTKRMPTQCRHRKHFEDDFAKCQNKVVVQCSQVSQTSLPPQHLCKLEMAKGLNLGTSREATLITASPQRCIFIFIGDTPKTKEKN